MVLVLLSALVKKFSVSRMRDFHNNTAKTSLSLLPLSNDFIFL